MPFDGGLPRPSTSKADILVQKLANPPLEPAQGQKKVSSKVTKAQRRAQQAEFNRQLWAEAYIFPRLFLQSSPDRQLTYLGTVKDPKKHSTSSKPAPTPPSPS